MISGQGRQVFPHVGPQFVFRNNTMGCFHRSIGGCCSRGSRNERNEIDPIVQMVFTIPSL